MDGDILQTRKASIFQYLAEGLDLEQAYMLSGVSEAERIELESNEDFKVLTSVSRATLEYALLQKLNRVIDINVGRGKSDEIRFMLQTLNRKRYGGREAEGAPPPVVVNIGSQYDGA